MKKAETTPCRLNSQRSMRCGAMTPTKMGTADVKEDPHTLTYNANGGKFTEEKEAKEVTVVAQDGYKLLASGEEGLPTHAKTNWNGTETAVVFMGLVYYQTRKDLQRQR